VLSGKSFFFRFFSRVKRERLMCVSV
jgi:hypothetical protein